ncbi:MAG: undecaprenyldiphospho-muramoylpentapeptide beta-N-acetylglucosaminyltransferase [Chloroflexi bacterium]|nr:undecaprenyldiphospho-muramoylpentapeptide beta-N-acetylglucosaminyltransferase [Ktedonobacteraceae bacterium]MBV9020118.1 undecaprenyldiphospho-muramoylpentapeptide beta-N-acetylglucosaminyltransferase [Ktedonobacteraceae bacterium]MBV9708597.1 undecaprenyldiphospho-muramoylpentapeptide beta-N-acetylglucosaminyltransferase [Chloroflexota bacterium]
MRVLISGGGTGGHIYPALAVATQLQKEYQADILYLGSDDGLETQVVPAAGLRLEVIKAGKLQRFVSWKTLSGIARVPLGIAQAIGIVRTFHPDVAFTSGGYVAVPAGLAAYFNSVPLLMHQQDVPPNLSNRLLAPLATRISVAFADSLRYFPMGKTIQLGNPLRQVILAVQETAPQQARVQLDFDATLPLLLVTGGSQGARHLNQVTCQALPQLLTFCQVLQISGSKLFDETREHAEHMLTATDEGTKRRYRLVPYMDAEMPLALQAATLVVCRSGASTLSELAVLGKPSILVPLPPSLGSSPQEVNAAMFEREQAAEVILNAHMKPEVLVNRVKSIISSSDSLQQMTESVSRLAKPQATGDIVENIVQLAKKTVIRTTNSEGVYI